MRGRVTGKGEFECRIMKHLAPVTVTKVQRALPISGRVNFYEKSFAYILTNVVTGEEKTRRDFEKGDVAFMAGGSMLCFFLESTRTYKPMNPLGEIISGMQVIEECRRGDSIEIEEIRLPGDTI